MKYRNQLIIGILLLALSAATAFHFLSGRSTSVPAVIAVGLRGTNRVTRPLSNLQRERLEKNFLETPPLPRPTGSAPAFGGLSGSGGTARSATDVAADVQALNAFNQRQRQ